MPWHISESSECDGYAVIKDSDGSVAGCHETEQGAKDQLAALYASEPDARGRYDHIDFTPPSGVREEAKRGLAWRREFGRGGTGVGIARARDLSNGVKISVDTARRMKAFFDRHQSDKNAEGWSPGEKGFPSNGRIAHALWGGDAGYAWARKLVKQIEAAAEDRSMEIETRSISFDDVSDGFPLLTVERRCESKDRGEESWLVGYAARFGVNSLKMDDFYERIDPGAFGIVSERRGRKSALETRALFNHDPNIVLGRYPTTLRLKVDERGLRYEIKMPRSQQALIESVERGDIVGSSFSFITSPGGDEWTIEEGRSIRTVKSIASLIDVGPVTFPAYPAADVAVARRSYRSFVNKRVYPALSRRAKYRRQREAIENFLRERGA